MRLAGVRSCECSGGDASSHLEGKSKIRSRPTFFDLDKGISQTKFPGHAAAFMISRTSSEITRCMLLRSSLAIVCRLACRRAAMSTLSSDATEASASVLCSTPLSHTTPPLPVSALATDGPSFATATAAPAPVASASASTSSPSSSPSAPASSSTSSPASSSAQSGTKPAHHEGKRWQNSRPNQRGGGAGGGGGQKEWVRTQRPRTADSEGPINGGDDDDGDGGDRVPKKKYAVLFGYAGTRYQGLQINGDAPTVEKALEQAIFDAGGLLASNHLEFQKIHWSRACRTDKGVHAAANVVSLKMNVLDGDAVAKINACLPDDIRVFAVARSTKSFNAWKECNERRYEYTMPTYCLQPMCVDGANS